MSLFNMLYENNACKLPTLKNPNVVYMFECLLPNQQVTLSPMKQFMFFPEERYMQASFVRGYLDELVVQDCAVLKGRTIMNVEKQLYGRCTYQSRDTSARYFGNVDNFTAELSRRNIDKKFTLPLWLSRLRVYENTLLQHKKKVPEEPALVAASRAYWK